MKSPQTLTQASPSTNLSSSANNVYQSENAPTWENLKHKIAKLVSVTLLFVGLKDIGISLYRIFQFTNAVQTGINTITVQFDELLKGFIVDGSSAIIETTYGLTLILMPKEKLKIFHLLIGAIIFLVPFFINDQFINQVEVDFIPKVQLAPSLAFAQETSPQQAYTDYQFQLQKYRNAHKKYLASKNAYLSFQTLNSRTQATQDTKDLLTQRSETLRTYLFALRINLTNTTAIPESEKNTLKDQLQAQEQFLSDHQQQVQSISSLADVTKVSSDLETTYPQIQILSYQTLLAILQGQETSLTQTLKNQQNTISTIINSADDSELNKPQINQWLEDISNTLDSNIVTHEQIVKQFSKIKSQKRLLISNQRNFTKVLQLIDQSFKNLQTVTNFIQESVQLIKYD